jgi:SulP family sulfate permease
VLDFYHVTGVDATAVRTCFLILRQKLAVHGVTLIFTGMPPSIAKLMRAQGVLTFEDDEVKLAGGSLGFRTVGLPG